ncbi:MAG: alpha/beta hydrolase [Methanomicrobiales archaeon]|nr:alpha/beta hydrolase [Methanomicrobiales archaeon]
MQRRSACSAAVSCELDHLSPLPVLLVMAIVLLLTAGCTGGHESTTRSYSVTPDGCLTITTPHPAFEITPLSKEGNITIERLILHTQSGDVFGLLAAPLRPSVAIVHAPGAGVTKESHQSRAVQYAQHGVAYLVLDIRGHGGETRGTPLNPQEDYRRFTTGGWPENYAIIADLIEYEEVMRERFGVPVIVSGESNGGRYAAVAAATDARFAGFIGISTSGFSRIGDTYQGDARRFLLSIDPDAVVGRIAPRPVWIFHAPGDTIIPFEEGKALYEKASEPRWFSPFNGTHGVTGEVDAAILANITQV